MNGWRSTPTSAPGSQVARRDHDRRGLPSDGCLHANAHALARYAALCQEEGIVPIVEPEVLMDGDQTIERSQEVTEAALRAVFDASCENHRVILEGIVLKPNMVLSGYGCREQASLQEVAEQTVECLRDGGAPGGPRRCLPLGWPERRARHRAVERDD